MRLRWNTEPGQDVIEGAQLDQALDALLAGPAADRPLIAYLAGDAGALGLGLDRADSGLLLFAPADRGRPALHGLPLSASADRSLPALHGLLLSASADRGRPALHGIGEAPGKEGDVVFSVSGRPYRFSGRCRVPAATVRAAARQYLATGKLPDCVGWEPEPGLPPDGGGDTTLAV